ncbi:hypothetical protein [Blastococcus tunisiensis]|uniref:Uncharacterized protein n=1 Tax=Blastococcus tunisiensis TaxID=1798228 RepID=A0A1I1Z7Q8_9ACTN|nr:hypothetical protein [Blastococcus sp. DSM 46838]SFE27894.1 hypothetical protein SAMN05216574_1038 [Blastococcus sp. DSM 46838]
MLALTPAPLQTAGEKALFGELTRWDTGGSVRAAVVASIPLIDGPLGRRISDAVLLVPEGIAVVRIAEVLRQSGVVRAVPEGAWTIAPESGPGQALQLSGGGSTPLDGLMRAGMDVAMKLRRAGLEPGRIARLTVLVGDVTGLVPGDGDLGEGDLVSLLEPRSLLLGIARASRYAGVDNPRLWTTADVRAALEALELSGRGPSVEELNGEGFPYSPYVLRRPELMTPAAMASAPPSAGPTAGPDVPRDAPAQPPVREQPSKSAIAQAVAASAAAAHAAAAQESEASEASGSSAAAAEESPRDTVAVDGPPAPPDDGGGIGGLFARGEPERPLGHVVPPRTSAAPPRRDVPPAAPPLYWSQHQQAEEAEERTGFRGRTAVLAVVGVLVLVALGVGGWLLLRDQDGGTATGPTATATTPPEGPAVGDVQAVGGAEYRVEAVQVDETCAGHAYGDTAAFLAATDCTGLSRALYSTQVEGAPVVVSVVRVRMPDTAVARQLQALTDRDGSGNISDLLREGVRYPGSPAELSGAEYASALSGTAVTIVETDWVDEGAAGGSAAIDAVADAGLTLPVPPLPAE